MLMQPIELAKLRKHTIRNSILNWFREKSVAVAISFSYWFQDNNTSTIVEKKCASIVKTMRVNRILRFQHGGQENCELTETVGNPEMDPSQKQKSFAFSTPKW
jgi:hypothetical protein